MEIEFLAVPTSPLFTSHVYKHNIRGSVHKIGLGLTQCTQSQEVLNVQLFQISSPIIFSSDSAANYETELYRVSQKKIARIRHTQNPFSVYIYMMCRGCWHMFIY